MATVNLDQANFDEITSTDGIVVVDAWAAWCGPCRMFAPVFEKAAERHPTHIFAKLDTQNEAELRDQLGIEHIPTLMVFRDGLLLYKDAGSPPAEVLDEIVSQAEAVDMSEVRHRQQQESETASDDGAA